MKRKIIFLVMLAALGGLFTLQSCEEEAGTITSFYTFTVPEVVSPADGAILNLGTATTVNLSWTSVSPEGDPIRNNVYFGTSATPPLYKTNNTTLSLSAVPVVKGSTYYWFVRMIDKNGIPTDGPHWSFTVFDAIAIFTGDFNCDEPAESYNYDVAFSKTTDNTITCDNYWNSGWEAVFTLDFTAKTYSMPLTTWTYGAHAYSAIESGTIDPATGTMVGNYTINYDGSPIETGVHTYVKL